MQMDRNNVIGSDTPFASAAWHVSKSSAWVQTKETTLEHAIPFQPHSTTRKVIRASKSSHPRGSNGNQTGEGGRSRRSAGASGKWPFSHWIPGFVRAARFGMSYGGGAAAFIGAGAARASPLWPLKGAKAGVARRSDKRKKILILMSDTGGGHRASAEALRAGFQQLYGDRFNFTVTQPQFVHLPIATAASAFVASSVSAAYEMYDPDLVVSVHPLMQHIPVRVLRQRVAAGLQDPSVTFATVVTDLTTCHNTWFYSGVDRCYVATEETKQQALEMGLEENQLRQFGLPIRPAFSRRYARKQRLRRNLGMDLRKPAILLVGGGEGMGPVEKTVDALANVIGADCQVVVVCGRNAKLVEKLKAKSYPSGMHVFVKGFVDNMPELMSASDAIITKAGPGTISEALICGLPMVLNAYVPCQEEGNIPYVTENGVGVFESYPEQVAEIIQGWLAGGQKELHKMAVKAKALGKPHALLDIVRDLSSLMKPRMALAMAGAQ